MKNLIKLFKRKIKNIKLRLSGKYKHLYPSVKINSKWYGNDYGGFYVFPDILNSDSIIYSFGIGQDISFDKAIINKHNCFVYAFDPTPKSINWVQNNKTPDKFIFFEYGLGKTDEFTDFYLPKNINNVSGSILKHSNVDDKNKVTVELKSLSTIHKELNHSKIDVLKIDIEGAEYDVIKSIDFSEINITQILVEFHDRFVTDGEKKSKEIVNLLNKEGYKIFAVSDTFEEVSFIKISEL